MSQKLKKTILFATWKIGSFILSRGRYSAIRARVAPKTPKNLSIAKKFSIAISSKKRWCVMNSPLFASLAAMFIT